MNKYNLKLENARMAKGMTARQMAEILGVDRTTYRKWERGISSVPDRQKVKIAELTNQSIEYLFF